MRAASLFATVTAASDVREAWLGLATARRRLGDTAGAAEALASALQRHVVDEGVVTLANAIAREAGAPGWCGMGTDLKIKFYPVSAAVANSGHLLGSPVDMAAIKATVGCVSARDGGWPAGHGTRATLGQTPY